MTATARHIKRSRRAQHGAALVIGLILLLVMTLLSITAMRGTLLQERMSGALSDQNIAFQAAESALREGEAVLGNTVTLDFSKAGWYDEGEQDSLPDWQEKPTDAAEIGTGVIGYQGEDMGWGRAPQFYVERMPPVVIDGDSGGSMAVGDGTIKAEYELYRIVARGFGKNDGTVAIVESIYRR